MAIPALSILLLVGLLTFAAAWVLRRRRAQRDAQLSALHKLAERILSAPSRADILHLLRSQGEAIFGNCEYRFYQFQRAGNRLEGVTTEGTDVEAASALANGQIQILAERTSGRRG